MTKRSRLVALPPPPPPHCQIGQQTFLTVFKQTATMVFFTALFCTIHQSTIQERVRQSGLPRAIQSAVHRKCTAIVVALEADNAPCDAVVVALDSAACLAVAVGTANARAVDS
jgi:hypothetical protein